MTGEELTLFGEYPLLTRRKIAEHCLGFARSKGGMHSAILSAMYVPDQSSAARLRDGFQHAHHWREPNAATEQHDRTIVLLIRKNSPAGGATLSTVPGAA